MHIWFNAVVFLFLSRHDKKKVIDKVEILDYEGEAQAAYCFDVFNTDSGIFLVYFRNIYEEKTW